MNALEVQGRWKIMKGRAKQKIAQWMCDDLQFAEGKEEELVGRIQKRSGEFRRGLKQPADDCCGCNQNILGVR
jgi:uncharacterized protein YjbJ (UPF0337 family)